MKFENLVSVCLLALAATANAVWAQVQAAPPLSGVIGAVQSFTGSSLDVVTKSGVVHVSVSQPLTTYTLGFEPPDLIEKPLDIAATEAAGRLIHQNNIGFRCDRPAYFHDLPCRGR